MRSGTSRPRLPGPCTTATKSETLPQLLLHNAHVLIRAMYGGTALAFRDRLIMDWNKTQQNHTFADQKRVYCEYERMLPKIA